MPKSKIDANRASDKEQLLSNKSNDDTQFDINNKSIPSGPSKSTQTTSNAGNRTKSIRPPPTGTATIRPNTIMSLEDRDIVVIDNIDVKESTSTEGTIIVVEKPIPYHIQQQQQPQQHVIKTQEVDLTELLAGTNWPAAAGDLAAAIGNQSTQNEHNNIPSFSSASTSSNSSSNYQQPAYIMERNRSKNILSHLAQSKKLRKINPNINPTKKSGNLINLDSDGSSSSNENHCKSFTARNFFIHKIKF